MTKNCNMCKTDKSLDDYYTDKARKDGKQNICKLCCKQCSKKHYENNKEKVLSRTYKRRDEIRKFVRDIKSEKKCFICHQDDFACLDLHHLDPSIKDDSIANLVSATMNLELIKSEMKKCVVLCKNCHAKFHADRFCLFNPQTL